jgi:endonuclease/exonuclease/phosphatase family metal-dependent hydrolase
VIRSPLIALALVVTGCGIDVGSSGEWVDIAQIDGMLAPGVGATPSVRALPAHGSTLRVMTYNILEGGIEPSLLAQAIKDNPELSKADVIFLQEVKAFPEEGEMRTARLAAALGMGWTYVPARPEKETGTFGNAILSRYPITNIEKMDLPLVTRKRQRIAVAADLQIGDLTLRVVNTHLDTTLNIPGRIRQLRPAVIDQPDAVLVAGDFNTSPYAWEDGLVPLVSTSPVVDTDQAEVFDRYMESLGFVNPTAAVGPTAAKYGVEGRLDAIYTRGLAVTGGNVDYSVDVSDHWPVWIDVTLP